MESNKLHDDIIDSFHKASQHLKEIWDDIGLTLNERESAYVKLVSRVKEIFQEEVKKQESQKDLLKHELLNGLEIVCKLCTSLGEPVKENNLESGTILKHLEKVRREIETLEKMKVDRVKIVTSLREKLSDLKITLDIEEMDESAASIEKDLTSNRIRQYEDEIASLTERKKERLALHQPVIEEIADLINELGISQESNDLTSDPSLVESLSTRTYSRLSSLRDRLLLEKQQREHKIEELAAQITLLWEQLNVSQEAREVFLSNNRGLGDAVIEACQKECNKLKAVRAGMLQELIEAAQAQLVACWEELHIGEEERSSLISSELFTEDTLTKLEVEIEKMKELLEIARPVLKLIEKREEIKLQKKELEQASSDPNRLLSKSGRDAGRLLREEKMRKAIEKDLPKIEEKLKASLMEWENKNSKPFMYNGTAYLSLMEDESRIERQKKEDEKMRKEKEKLLKKDETAKTPNKLSLTSKGPVASLTPQKRSALSLLSPNSSSGYERQAKTPKLKGKTGEIENNSTPIREIKL